MKASEKKKNKENEVKPKKLLKAKIINLVIFTLKIILGEAVRLKLLASNPCYGEFAIFKPIEFEGFGFCNQCLQKCGFDIY